MGLPSWLGGAKKSSGNTAAVPSFASAASSMGAPRMANGLLAPPPAPANAVATAGGFAATNAARRQRKIAAASSSSVTAKPAPAQTPTPPKLRNAGLAAMGLY